MNLKDKLTIRSGIKGCSTCGGVGFYLEELVSGSSNGRLSLCNCLNSNCFQCYSKGKPPYYEYDPETDKMIPCACHEARTWIQKMEASIIKANIPPRYQYKFFTSIDLKIKDENLSLLSAHDWADELVRCWKDTNYKRKGMYLWGGTGSGKTLLACVILNELIFHYQADCKYAKIGKDFLDALKDTYQKGSEFHGMERNILEDFVNVDVLVIDDFGVQKETEWANSKLYDLIDSRYERQKTTLLTSNSSPEEWKQMGEGRVYSRLCEMSKDLHIQCSDYRMRYK